MKRAIPLLTLLLLFILSSCGPRVVTNRAADVNLDSYRSYAYLPNAEVNFDGDIVDGKKVNERLIGETNWAMRQAGYALDRDNPDLLVLIETQKITQREVDRDPVYANTTLNYRAPLTVNPYYNNYYYTDYATYDYNRVIGYERETYRYKDGTVIISLIDRESGQMVWQGLSSDNIYTQETTQEMVDLVEAIFKEYPINTTAKR